jgi:hydrogenase expression/formation protein HypC
MCITAPARVIAVDNDGAIVETIGARRRASTLVLPDAAVGDWVIVGAGSIHRRLEPAEALELARTIGAAMGGADAAVTTTTTLAHSDTHTAGGPR